MKKILLISLGIFQAFVGITAIVSSALLILFPSGSVFNAPIELLKSSPFSNFFIPGIILFSINGVGQIAASILTFRKHQLAGYTGALFGIALMIWIFIQVNMIGGGEFLQFLYFFIGVVETSLAFLIQVSLLGRPNIK